MVMNILSYLYSVRPLVFFDQYCLLLLKVTLLGSFGFSFHLPPESLQWEMLRIEPGIVYMPSIYCNTELQSFT